MNEMFKHLKTRPRMAIATVVGILVGCLVPDVHLLVTRLLLGWNVSVWLFLILVGTMMLQSDHERLRRNAIAQAEGAAVVLALVTVAAIFSIVAILVELSAAKGPGAHHALGHILFALVTVAGSWLLLPTLFAMNYASLYYDNNESGGLEFPSNEKEFQPDYSDFLYFSFTIAVASQTADVSISDRPMRRLVLLQSVLSFVFNTTILAFTINIAAGLF
jgi:uncharacterized membrane protein